MKGDFTRDSFHAERHYSKVLMQQGRVQVDADWNEQVSILFHRLEVFAQDIIGPFGGPAGSFGFAILADEKVSTKYQRNFGIAKGRYYVDGILCENDAHITYTHQFSAAGGAGHHLDPGGIYLIYLDVWEQYVSPAQDPHMREIALGGPDTCARARVAWLVRAHKLDAARNCKDIRATWSDAFVPLWQPDNRGMLRARASNPANKQNTTPCITPPDSRYRGAENQLYRVEVHHTGSAPSGATFKWSRENGSVAFAVARVEGQIVTLDHLGRDARLGIQTGDWIELCHGFEEQHSKPGQLSKVTKIDPAKFEVTLDGNVDAAATLLRRWDQKAGPDGKPASLVEGAVPIREGKGETAWIAIEDGIEIQFQLPASGAGNPHYRSGDYWLIPARTASGGQVEWPQDKNGPVPLDPQGVEHHYAPLAVITLDAAGATSLTHDCRQQFSPLIPPGA